MVENMVKNLQCSMPGMNKTKLKQVGLVPSTQDKAPIPAVSTATVHTDTWWKEKDHTTDQRANIKSTGYLLKVTCLFRQDT